MNKVKYALSAIALFAAIGGAFAFKKAKVSPLFWQIDTNPSDGYNNCTVTIQAYLYATPQQRSVGYYYDTDGTPTCDAYRHFILTLN